MNKKTYIPLGLITTVLLSALPACQGSQQAKQEEQIKDSINIPHVESTSAQLESISLEENFSTTLIAKVSNNISAQTGGRLRQLLVEVGDRVAKGQVVARLEATQLSTAQIQLNDAQLALDRMEELYKVGAVSKSEWERAKSNRDITRQQLNNISTNTELRSPISGIVTKKNYDNGDVTNPSQAIVVIEQISPLKAIINVSEANYNRLRKGLIANLQVEAFPNQTFEGTVSNIYPTIDNRTHTVGVEIEFKNNDLRLRPGMYGTLHLGLGSRETILIPRSAVQRTIGSGTRYVYVIQNNKLSYRVVETGATIGNKQEITSGLNVGELVVVNNNTSLSNGQQVKL